MKVFKFQQGVENRNKRVYVKHYRMSTGKFGPILHLTITYIWSEYDDDWRLSAANLRFSRALQPQYIKENT